MKLEIKHIAPYVKHRLMTTNGLLIGVELYQGRWHTKTDYNPLVLHTLKHTKLLLKPLSELPSFQLNGIANRRGITPEEVKGYIESGLIGYTEIEVLCSNHYDIFGLIDNGLAEVKG